MKKFNITKDFQSLEGFSMPKGSLYGKDSKGYWICTNIPNQYKIKEHNPVKIHRLSGDVWACKPEKSATSKMIIKKVQEFNIEPIPEYVWEAHREYHANKADMASLRKPEMAVSKPLHTCRGIVSKNVHNNIKRNSIIEGYVVNQPNSPWEF